MCYHPAVAPTSIRYFADGRGREPVREYVEALRRSGNLGAVASFCHLIELIEARRTSGDAAGSDDRRSERVWELRFGDHPCARSGGSEKNERSLAVGRTGSDALKHLRDLTDRHPGLRAEYERLQPRFDLIRQLVRARKRANLTQRELGERIGVSRNVITRLESGEHTPRLETAQQAARALGYRLEVKLVRERPRARA